MSSPSSSATSIPPPRPRLVLRLGFAGRKELTDPEQRIVADSLHQVMQTLAKRLSSIAPGTPVESGKEPPVSAFFSKQCPLLRLVTGLCEGTDAVAADAKPYQERQILEVIAKSASTSQLRVMKLEDQYHRSVRWSDEDQCYIGYCPDLYLAGVCHHESEENCYAELCDIVRDEVAHRTAKSDTLPKPQIRITRDLDFATP